MTDEHKTPLDLIFDTDHEGVVKTFERVGSSTGVANIHRAVANAADIFAAYIEYVYGVRHKMTLDAADRELAICCVLERHQGHYELPPHRRFAITLGLTEEQVLNVRNPDARHLFSPRQQAILDFTERFGADPDDRPNMPRDRIEDFLNSRERVELGLSLALYMGMSHFTSVFDIPIQKATDFRVPVTPG